MGRRRWIMDKMEDPYLVFAVMIAIGVSLVFGYILGYLDAKRHARIDKQKLHDEFLNDKKQ
jgi:hypothetical protein